MSDDKECPTCNGSGRVPAKSTVGKRPHNYDWKQAVGPWGYRLAVCVRCMVERTHGQGNAIMYREPGGEWEDGFKGCKR